MLRILGSPKRLCTGPTRRDFLHAGSLSLLGLGLADYFRLSEAQAAPKHGVEHHFGKAKACILLYLYGSPSQIETFDMKPNAPVEVRGEFKHIPSSVPGLDVCELLPNLAREMHRTTVLRSVTHPYPIHGVAFATTGIPAIDVAMELAPFDMRHHPYFGSVVQYLERHQAAGRPADIPENVAFPFPFSSQRVGEVPRAGPYAAFLGSTYNPTWTEFIGKSTRSVQKTLRDMKVDVPDPYVGCDSGSHFRFSTTAPLPQM